MKLNIIAFSYFLVCTVNRIFIRAMEYSVSVYCCRLFHIILISLLSFILLCAKSIYLVTFLMVSSVFDIYLGFYLFTFVPLNYLLYNDCKLKLLRRIASESVEVSVPAHSYILFKLHCEYYNIFIVLSLRS